MKADPAVQLRLLDLQSVDSGLDRLAARRRDLPELAVIAERTKVIESLAADVVRVETEISDLGRLQRRLDDEIDLVRSRADRDRRRLDSGEIGNARELENLQTELASLARRQGTLEDEALEKMEAAEELDGRLAKLRAERDRVQADLDAATRDRDAAFAEIDAQAAARRGERSALAPELPAPLVTLYEKIRGTSNGVGAAKLVRRRCEGCHLELSGADLREVAAAAADEVVRCEECRRILVRTAESGL
jgi:predicted  nucleic acid-binding Zn-ribbon protein